VRDLSAWLGRLPQDLRSQGFPDDVMPAAEFCRVELGLYFLATHFPGEPAGVLQSALSGYVQVGEDLDAVIRRVRHRMGDVARRGYWRKLLNQYMRIPDAIRGYDRTDDPARRVSDKTVFAARPSSVCADRDDTYAAALADPLAYRPARQHPPAEAGKRYAFTAAGATEYVRFPSELPSAAPVPLMSPAASRVRERWTVSFEKDLGPAAEWVDEQLAGRPDITNRNWRKRLDDLWFSLVDETGGGLEDRPAEFAIDGTDHIVGLMNSGKTTLTDLIVIDGALNRGKRSCIVVGSVGDVYAKVSFLRALGIDAIPLIGRSSRGEHAARYWRIMVEEAAVLIPDEYHPADPAAAYANTSCLLEPCRETTRPDWAPLRPEEFPCRGQLREADAESPRACDCPLLGVCPAQKALREAATAQVWVTTAQCLVSSKAEPASAEMRWLEQAQHDMDLLVIDEADAVQRVLDTRFVQTEQLVATDKGWSHRMAGYTNDALAGLAMAPAVDPDVQQWHEYLQIHQQAVFMLNRLALSPDGRQLRDLLGDSTFTAHSLFRQAARMLHGLPRRGEGDKGIEDAAEDFYQRQLQDFAEQPAAVPGHGLQEAVAQLTRLPRDDEAVRSAIDRWIDASATAGAVKSGSLGRSRDLLRLVIGAAIWSRGITTTFFEMVTLYPSVRDRLQLPDEDTFWLDQPPRDYRPLVPEAPMGNILALRWAASRGGGASLQLLWVHGVGRWLLHHAHDLLACEAIEGPHVILTSATSWLPGSSFYHIPITPTAVLRQKEEDRDALMDSTMVVRPARIGGTGDPIFVSGRRGEARFDALRQMVTALCDPVGGRQRSVVDELRAQLPAGRQQILFVVLSGLEARVVSEAINHRTPYTARHVVPDASDPGEAGILRRMVGGFGNGTDDILVAAEMSIQRGYNILNSADTAALGAVIYLTRSHPPPSDLEFPLSLVCQMAMDRLQHPALASPGQAADVARQLRSDARYLWFGVIGRPVHFRTIGPRFRTAFVANNLVPMSQTIGRSIRGNQPTRVLLSDAAFAERLATGDSAPDTVRTSLVVATDALLSELLRPPGPGASPDQLRVNAINEAVWLLLGHLVCTNEPLGSRKQ
jgi:pPIWI RE three-gene island domain Z